MGEIDSFGEYVRERLDEWGQEFSLSRDCEYLGHQSKNMLQVLIEHRGEMPGRAIGFKPLEVSLSALVIEQVVSEIARDQSRTACCLRAFYCGQGRRKVERYKTAMVLIAGAAMGREPIHPTSVELRSVSSLRGELEQRTGLKMPGERQYMAEVDTGRTLVRGALIGIARAA
jgi:hypothetical protein